MPQLVIIHTGGIGDLVQAIPAMRAARAARPGARVTLLGHPERGALAVMAGAADRCRSIETAGLERPETAPALAAADRIIDFLTRGRLEAALGGKVATIAPLPPADWTRGAAAWLLGEVATALDTPAAPPVPEIPVPGASLAPRAVLHPGSGSVRKNWPLPRFEALARQIEDEAHLEVRWLLGPAERERGTEPRRGQVLGPRVLAEVAAALAGARLYVGNDSGITHLAAAVRRPDGRPTPTVALFGPTDPRVWAPRGEHVRVVRAADGEMASIEEDEVWAHVNPLARRGS